jgi:hypothetical protein
LLFTFLAFSVSVSLDFLCMAHAFLPERLSNHCQGLLRTSFGNLHKICTKCSSFVGSIAKSKKARSKIPNKRSLKISTSTQLREMFYTDSQDMLILSSTVASRYYSCCTDVAPVPEFMDTLSYVPRINDFYWKIEIFRCSY